MNIKKQRGYTILETTIVLLILAATAAFSVPLLENKTNNILINVTKAEIGYINRAAHTYSINNTSWPDEANNCVGAISTLTSGQYLANIDTINPFGNAYSFSCTPQNFTVNSIADNANLAREIATETAATTVAGNQTTTTVPVASLLPALQNLLARDGSDGGMTGDLDMNRNDIRAVNDIYLSSAREWISNMIIHDEGIVAHGTIIRLPSCPNGSGQVYANVVHLVQQSNPEPLTGFRVYAVYMSGNRARLYARRQIGTSFESPGGGEHYIHYHTKCV